MGSIIGVMIQALMLKIAALSLLLLLGQNPNLPVDFRTQAEAVAQQALATADSTLSATSSVPVESSSPAVPSQTLSPSPTEPMPSPTLSEPITNNSQPMPESKARIDIISPFPGKGLGRTYKAAPQISDESNYIELGAVVYDAAGDPTNQPTVTIAATDSSQNKTLVQTGDVTPIYVNGEKRVVPVYAFHYEFHTAGAHVITLSTPELSGAAAAEVTVEAQ